MAIASENKYPKIILTEQGSTPASPAAGDQKLFIRSSDHVLCRVNAAGTVIPLESGNGDVIGPASAVDNKIAVWDGASGKLLKDSGVALPAFPYQALIHFGSGLQSAGTLTLDFNANQVMNHVFVTSGGDGTEVSFSFPLKAGTYNFSAIGYKYTSSGKIDWYLDGATFLTAQDWYNATSSYNQVNTATGITVVGDGLHVIKAKANGKNASSTNYLMRITYFTLIRTGA